MNTKCDTKRGDRNGACTSEGRPHFLRLQLIFQPERLNEIYRRLKDIRAPTTRPFDSDMIPMPNSDSF